PGPAIQPRRQGIGVRPRDALGPGQHRRRVARLGQRPRCVLLLLAHRGRGVEAIETPRSAPIFHLAARYRRRSSGTETTARVRIPREPAIGRSKNANIRPSALIMELMKFSSSMAPSTMPRIAGATGKPFSSMT